MKLEQLPLKAGVAFVTRKLNKSIQIPNIFTQRNTASAPVLNFFILLQEQSGFITVFLMAKMCMTDFQEAGKNSMKKQKKGDIQMFRLQRIQWIQKKMTYDPSCQYCRCSIASSNSALNSWNVQWLTETLTDKSHNQQMVPIFCYSTLVFSFNM